MVPKPPDEDHGKEPSLEVTVSCHSGDWAGRGEGCRWLPQNPSFMSSRRSLVAVVGLCILLMPISSTATARDEVSLGIGDSFFRQGRASGSTSYRVDIAPGGAQLRVAIDRPYPSGSLKLLLLNPSGRLIGQSAGTEWSAELFVPNPAPGSWAIEVEGTGDYSIRAKLEDRQRPSQRVRALLPNLRVVPPFDFSYTPGPAGCLADEIVENQATNCLRFAVGFEDAGDGPLQLEFDPIDGTVQQGTMYQRIFYSNGKTKRREAGAFEYHKTHAHYHHVGLGTMLLYRVLDERTGKVEQVGTGPKLGFCMGEYRLAGWWRFFQEWKGDDQSTCRHLEHGDTPTGAIMGLSNGWADVYPKEISGNYVEFSDELGLPLGDGRYLITIETDGTKDVLETNDRDNFGYALIDVSGAKVDILERGRGRSPWDRDAVRVDRFHHDIR